MDKSDFYLKLKEESKKINIVLNILKSKFSENFTFVLEMIRKLCYH